MKKILVIEDDRIMRENISELLEIVGFQVETASNGREGVKKAQTNRPDLIICDIKMPVLDGYGVLHILQKSPETAIIPFIFLTAKTERYDMRKGMEMGADDYLAKPFEDTELLKAVETRLKKKRTLFREDLQRSDDRNLIIDDDRIMNSFKQTMQDSELLDFKTKEIIFKTGNFPHNLFYIEKGSVKTYLLNADGKEFITNIYEAGDFFGYQPIFEERAYNETAIALEPAKIYKLPKDDFLDYVSKNKGVANTLVKMISKTLSEKEKEMLRLAYDSVRKRVALKLLELIPSDEDGTITISRTDLASLVGTTTETLVRTLTELRDLQLIDTDQHQINLHDRKKLAELARKW